MIWLFLMLKNLNAIMETVKYKRGATDVSKNYEKLSETYYDHQAKKFDRSFDGFLSGFFKR